MLGSSDANRSRCEDFESRRWFAGSRPGVCRLSAPNRAASARSARRPAASPPLRRFETRWIQVDPSASRISFRDAVRAGLRNAPKTLPSRFFYDETGSRLFEEICQLPEYYLTRAESEILEAVAPDLAREMPDIRMLVELGSGSAVKTEALLQAFDTDARPLSYAPIDVSRSALEEGVERLELNHPRLEILPAIAEYESGLAQIHALGLGPKLLLWLGSSIGNLERSAAIAFLAHLRATMHEEDRLLIGIDLRKDRGALERAYDDSRGVTARFNLNLLTRINRELAGNFDLDQFRHRVHYDEPSGSVQSFIESRRAQRVSLRELGFEVAFEAGERIHTEDSHKYSVEEIDALTSEAGLGLVRRDLDQARRFTLNLFRPRV